MYFVLLQPSYPRTTHIRKGWLIRQIILYLIFTGLQGFIIEQVSHHISLSLVKYPNAVINILLMLQTRST